MVKGARVSRATNLNITEDTSMDRLMAKGVSKVAVLLPPWIVAPIIFGMGAAYHALFGGPDKVAWAVMGMTLCTVVLAVLSWLVSHQRGALGRWCITTTTALAGLWVVSATISGATASGTLYAALVGGPTLALGFNIRSVIRMTGHEDAVNDRLSWLFDRGAEPAGVKGRMRTIEQGEHKIRAQIAVEPGAQTADDVQKKVARLESGMQIPPGSLVASPNEDRADHVDVTVTDPRIMKKPIPWPGPSRPGASIAETMRVGMWQDADPVAYTLQDHHLMLMGTTGSGKSFGGAWNILAEAITRPDVAIWASDITKADQTLGALAPALDWVATSKGDAVRMLDAVQRIIKPRTAHLSARRLKAWAPGCGLTYLVVHIEEAPDVLDALGDKRLEVFLSSLKAARSAGITIILSLQRADWSQLPTLARGQLTGRMVFGVADEADAAFGLPSHVIDAGARPEAWGSARPGMCYLVAPGIAEARYAMPVRTYLIEDADMRAHAAAHPATARPLDAITVSAAGEGYANRAAADLPAMPEDSDDDEVSALDEHMHTEDPSPDITAGMDDPIEDDPDDAEFTFTRPARGKASTEDARAALRDQIEEWRREGREDFTTANLRDVWDRVGRSRSWIVGELRTMLESGALDRDDESGRYIIRAPIEV